MIDLQQSFFKKIPFLLQVLFTRIPIPLPDLSPSSLQRPVSKFCRLMAPITIAQPSGIWHDKSRRKDREGKKRTKATQEKETQLRPPRSCKARSPPLKKLLFLNTCARFANLLGGVSLGRGKECKAVRLPCLCKRSPEGDQRHYGCL